MSALDKCLLTKHPTFPNFPTLRWQVHQELKFPEANGELASSYTGAWSQFRFHFGRDARYLKMHRLRPVYSARPDQSYVTHSPALAMCCQRSFSHASWGTPRNPSNVTACVSSPNPLPSAICPPPEGTDTTGFSMSPRPLSGYLDAERATLLAPPTGEEVDGLPPSPSVEDLNTQ